MPRDPELWVQFGLARRGAGKLAPAVEAYERAVELDPACVEAYQNWGNLELGRENRPRALELFRRELELNPSHLVGGSDLQSAYNEGDRSPMGLA